VLARLFRVPLILVIVFVATTSGCSRSPEDESATLCEDLGNLRATVALIGAPPADATVGQLRGATEKLEPTIRQAERAGVVPDDEAQVVRAAQEAVLEALEGIGDDTPVTQVATDRLALTRDLVEGYQGLVMWLRCPAADTPS
jgi:hypothetical protein